MNAFDFASKQLDLIDIEKNSEVDRSKYVCLNFFLNEVFPSGNIAA